MAKIDSLKAGSENVKKAAAIDIKARLNASLAKFGAQAIDSKNGRDAA